MKSAEPTPLARAITLAGGMTALAKKLTERGHTVKDHRTVYQWMQSRIPAEYCPDVEAITGVRCEEMRPDVNWSVLRKQGPDDDTFDPESSFEPGGK